MMLGSPTHWPRSSLSQLPPREREQGVIFRISAPAPGSGSSAVGKNNLPGWEADSVVEKVKRFKEQGPGSRFVFICHSVSQGPRHRGPFLAVFTDVEGTWPWPFSEDGCQGSTFFLTSSPLGLMSLVPAAVVFHCHRTEPLPVLSVHSHPSPWSIATEDRVLVPIVTLALHQGLSVY